MSFLLHPSFFSFQLLVGNTFDCFPVPQKSIEHFRKFHAKYLLRSLNVAVLRSVLNMISVS